MVASSVPPAGDLACIPGMCPDQDLNQQHFGSQASAQSTEPYYSGHITIIFNPHTRICYFKKCYRLCYYSCPNFSSLPPSTQLSPDSHRHSPIVYQYWLRKLIPSPSLNQSLPSSSPLAAVSVFHVSMSLVLFCLLVYFVH